MLKPSRLEEELRQRGVEAVTTSLYERRFYSRDVVVLPRFVTALFDTLPAAIVKPRTIEEAAATVRYCFERNIPVVPRGAGTSGLFGAVPKKGGVVLDLQGLARLLSVDREKETVHVEAGIVCAELDRILGKQGLALKSYPSSALSATLGGWIMGSGLGLGSLRYGPISSHLRCAQVLLADGTLKEVTAEQDMEWLCESEGILAILTSVCLDVRKLPDSGAHHLIYFEDVQRLFGFVQAIVGTHPVPFAVEIYDSSYLSLLTVAGYRVTDFAAGGGAVLVTYQGPAEETAQATNSLEKSVSAWRGERREGAQTEWKHRFNMLRVKRAVATLLPVGVHVPLQNLYAFHQEVVKKGKRKVALLGQVVSPTDCMIMAMAKTDERRWMEHVLACGLPRKIFDAAVSRGGKPGGGVGVWNTPYKKVIMAGARIETLKRRKAQLDPKNLLNPGMWLDDPILFRPLLYRAAMTLLSSLDRLLPEPRYQHTRRGSENEINECVQCGYCVSRCPTRGEWASATPKGRISTAKKMFDDLANGRQPVPESTKSIFGCTLCGRCAVDCSVSIDSPTLWVDARDRLVRKGMKLDSLEAVSRIVTETNNIAGKPNEQRQQWAARVPAFEEIRAKKRADIIYFVGCVTSFYPTVQDIARSFVRILMAGGVDFMLLGSEERCCGYPLISAGHLDAAVDRMRENIRVVRETGARTLVVTCPGCYRMWKHEYQRLTGESTGVEVLHSAELLQRMIGEGAIRPARLPGSFTYHDPCDLGRVSGIYEAPRSIISTIATNYVELDESREYSACCGSGGDLLASNQELSLAIAKRRIDQVQETGADTVVTACPSCIRGMTMAKTAAKAVLAILDITQLVWRAMESGATADIPDNATGRKEGSCIRKI